MSLIYIWNENFPVWKHFINVKPFFHKIEPIWILEQVYLELGIKIQSICQTPVRLKTEMK